MFLLSVQIKLHQLKYDIKTSGFALENFVFIWSIMISIRDGIITCSYAFITGEYVSKMTLALLLIKTRISSYNLHCFFVFFLFYFDKSEIKMHPTLFKDVWLYTHPSDQSERRIQHHRAGETPLNLIGSPAAFFFFSNDLLPFVLPPRRPEVFYSSYTTTICVRRRASRPFIVTFNAAEH